MNASPQRSFGHLVTVTAVMLLAAGCTTTVMPPKLTNVPRGATQVDIYGRWVNKLATLGRGQYRMTYVLEYAPAGTVIRTNNNTGVVTSGSLSPLDSARIATVFSVANNKAVLLNADSTTDVTGRAGVSLRPASGPGGGETLTISIYYTNVFSAPLTDTDDFEVDLQATTAFE